jgi:hypothetical protein
LSASELSPPPSRGKKDAEKKKKPIGKAPKGVDRAEEKQN